MPSAALQILLIGDASRADFQDACAELDEMGDVVRCSGVEAAVAVLADDNNLPHAVMLAQSWPDQFSAASIDRLRNLAPLARVIAIQGSWCEGEPRSGHPLPGVIRIYWHQAAVRIRREFSHWAQEPASAWNLPTTATDEERLMAAMELPLPTGSGLVAIWTRRREMEELLADACHSAGYATAWLHPRRPNRVQGAVAAIYDGARLDDAGLAELTRLENEVSPAPIVALLDAPRSQDVGLARKLGAVVMAKPFRVDELLFVLANKTASGNAQGPGVSKVR